jgi:hypothetical protein
MVSLASRRVEDPEISRYPDRMAGGRCVTETPLGVKCREGRLSIRRSGAVQ